MQKKFRVFMVEDIVLPTQAFMVESILLPHGRGLYVSLWIFQTKPKDLQKISSPQGRERWAPLSLKATQRTITSSPGITQAVLRTTLCSALGLFALVAGTVGFELRLLPRLCLNTSHAKEVPSLHGRRHCFTNPSFHGRKHLVTSW